MQYDTLTYKPVGQAPELKYFLMQFVTKHFGRIRATVKQQYAESFYFLDAALADATMASDQQDTRDRAASSAAPATRSKSRSATSRSSR